MGYIQIKNPNLGGIADSAYLGRANSVAGMLGIDLHSEPGIMKVNQRLVKDSGSTVDVRINKIVACSDTNTYLFGGSGKIFMRAYSNGAYSLVHTAAPGVGGTDIIGAFEYDGFLYWATEKKVGRWEIGQNWSTADDAWATFENADASYHTMTIQNLVLFIADGNFVAQVDNDKMDGSGTIASSGTTVTGTSTKFNTEAKVRGHILFTNADGSTQTRTITAIASDTSLTIDAAFSPDVTAGSTYQLTKHVFSIQAVDLPKGKKIKTLGKYLIELLIGTRTLWAEVYRWNTWSVSFSASDETPEQAVNAFLITDNYTLAQIGQTGNIYEYAQDMFNLVKKIPGDYTTGGQSYCEPDATTWFRALPMFGITSVGGGAPAGVWSFGKANPSYPMILNHEYAISTGNITTANVTSMQQIVDAAGTTMLVAWKDGSNYGVDRVDSTTKYDGAKIETLLITSHGKEEMRDSTKRVVRVNAAWRTLPAGCSIEFWVKKNHGLNEDQTVTNTTGWTQITETKVDIKRKIVTTEVSIDDAMVYQIRVVLRTSGNTAPELEEVKIDI